MPPLITSFFSILENTVSSSEQKSKRINKSAVSLAWETTKRNPLLTSEIKHLEAETAGSKNPATLPGTPRDLPHRFFIFRVMDIGADIAAEPLFFFLQSEFLCDRTRKRIVDSIP